jgi:cobalt-zinc-cadmium efflux system membrane fusion protein
VILDANESDLRALKVGMPLVVTSTQFPEDAFAGQLAQLSDSVDPAARTVKLRGIVPNPDRTLKAEMFVSARVKLPKGADPTVNAKAVYSQGARRFVFVRTLGNTFTRRAVRTGPEFEGHVPVHSGLAAGEEVAINGNLFLQQMVSSARPPEKP